MPAHRSPTVHRSLDDLLDAAPPLRRHGPWLWRAWSLLRPPSVAMLLPALQRLRTMSQTLGWELPLVSDISAEDYDYLLQQLVAAPGMDVPCMDTSGLGTAYPVWVTLISHLPERSSYSCLHALFLLYASHRRAKAVSTFASAIRRHGATLRAPGSSETLLQILAEIEPAEDPQGSFDLLCLHSDRIERTKPGLATVLFDELPKLLDLDYPQFEEPLDWQPPTPISFPVPDTLFGEPADEQISPDMFVTPGLAHPREQPSLRTEVLRAEQAIRTGNSQWVATHVSCLSLPEAKLAVSWLADFALDASRSGRLVEHTGAILLLLMLATGREVKRAASLLDGVGRQDVLPRIDPDRGKLAQPVMMNKDAYQPELEARTHLRPVTAKFEVDLPPPLVDLLRSWKTTVGSRIDPLRHTDSIFIVLREMRDATAIDFTEGRIRHTLACHAYDQCQDPVQVMWITMDSNGHSLAPTHYCAIPISTVAETYSRTTWPIFAPDIEPELQRDTGLIGSRNLPKNDFLRKGVSSLLRRFNDPTAKATDPRGIAKKHNIMIQYVTAMLVVITGHRPAESLFKLTRWDFHLEEGLAIYQDKKSDPSHFYRPVALGSQISQQLRNYQKHLSSLEGRLAKMPGTANLRKQVADAMDGESPWFFKLTEELDQYSPTVTQWRQDFQEAFPSVQPNFGRTVIASEWRGIPRGAEFAHLQLGHFGILGLPFEGEGPTSALDMARALSEPVDTLWRKQGWQLRKGLGTNRAGSDEEKGSRRCAVLQSWAPALNALKAESNHYRKRVREARRERGSTVRPVAERIFFRRLEIIHPKLSRLIQEYGSRRADGEVSQRCRLSPAQIDQLVYNEGLAVPGEEDDEVDEAVQVALENLSNQFLRSARDARYYSGPIPRRRVVARQVGMTPFLPGIFAATAVLEELRTAFFREIPRDPPEENLTRIEWEFGRLALGLAIFAAVDSEEILEGLLDRRGSFEVNPVSDDGILVQISDDPPRVWGLWNIGAAVHLSANRVIGNDHDPPDPERLNEILAFMIPDRLIGKGEANVTGCLLQTVSMENRIRFSSLARQALDPVHGSWSLRLERQIALLRNSLDPSEAAHKPEESTRRRGPIVVSDRKSIRKAYDDVVGQIPALGRTIRDEHGNLLIPPATWRRYRRQVISRLQRTVVERPELPEIGRAFAIWAIWMLRRERSPGDYVLSEGSVRKYLGLVGPPLVSRMKALSPTVLDDEEFVDLYQEIIEEKSPGVRRATARELLNFHNILVREFGAPEVDSSEFADYLTKVENRVNPELVLPQEAIGAMRLFSNTRDDELPSHEYDLRLYNQVRLLFVLLIVTGARLGEIVGLHFRDLYQINEFLYLRIRPNYFRPTKTKAGKRILEISSALDPAETNVLMEWLHAERRRIGKRSATCLVFSDLLNGDPLDRAKLREPIQLALRHNSPMPIGAYQLRHARGTRVQFDCAVATNNASKDCRIDSPLVFPTKPKCPFLFPRDLLPKRIWMGHAQLTTTNRSYGHMPWVYQWPRAVQMEKYLDVQAVMSIRNASYEAARKYCKRNSKGLSEALVSGFMSRSNKQLSAHTCTDTGINKIPLQPPEHLPSARYLMLAAQNDQYEELWRSCGLTLDEAHALRSAARLVAQETGIAFFGDDLSSDGKAGRARASALPRMSPATQVVVNLLDVIYDAPDEVGSIVRSYIATAIPSRRQSIRLEHEAAAHLERFVDRHCPRLRLSITGDGIVKLCTLQDFSGAEYNHLLGWILAVMATIHYSGLSHLGGEDQAATATSSGHHPE